MPLREFRELADLNAQARNWVMKEAGVRLHGTTLVTDVVRVGAHAVAAAAAAAAGSRQPAVAPDLSTWHKASVQPRLSCMSWPLTSARRC